MNSISTGVEFIAHIKNKNRTYYIYDSSSLISTAMAVLYEMVVRTMVEPGKKDYFTKLIDKSEVKSIPDTLDAAFVWMCRDVKLENVNPIQRHIVRGGLSASSAKVQAKPKIHDAPVVATSIPLLPMLVSIIDTVELHDETDTSSPFHLLVRLKRQIAAGVISDNSNFNGLLRELVSSNRMKCIAEHATPVPVTELLNSTFKDAGPRNLLAIASDTHNRRGSVAAYIAIDSGVVVENKGYRGIVITCPKVWERFAGSTALSYGFDVVVCLTTEGEVQEANFSFNPKSAIKEKHLELIGQPRKRIVPSHCVALFTKMMNELFIAME